MNFLNHAHEEREENMKMRYTNPKIRKAFDLLEKMSEDDFRCASKERRRFAYL